MSSQIVAYSGFSNSNYIREAYSTDLDFGTGEWSASAWIKVDTLDTTTNYYPIFERSFSSGPSYSIGIEGTGKLKAVVYDGTTTRIALSTNLLSTGYWYKVRVNYTTDGAVTIYASGQQYATATGTALLTLNNANAVLTIGNNYSLNSPFPGSLALIKISGTVPTSEQMQFAYEQEKQMFIDNSQVTLPDSNVVLGIAFDDDTNRIIAASQSTVSYWSGLVRVATDSYSTGTTISGVSAGSGTRLVSTAGNTIGVDVTIPAVNIKTMLERDRASENIQQITVFDYDPVDNSQTVFALPTGYTAQAVYKAGVEQRESFATTKDWSRSFDGFKESITFTTAPGTANWIQIHATKDI